MNLHRIGGRASRLGVHTVRRPLPPRIDFLQSQPRLNRGASFYICPRLVGFRNG